MKLPAIAALDVPGARAILAALDAATGETRLVGGAVRDALLQLPVKDIDLATRLTPDVVMKRLKAAGLKAVPTGLQHGTVTAVAEGSVMEVTTLRRDVATDGRHAEVAFTGDWREDAARRDFTINALYADAATGEVFDWFGGEADLAARRVRFIGDPFERIAEDHLRILRFFRFHARFGLGAPDAEGLAACAARANDLMALSRERIAMELRGLMTVDDPGPALAVMLAHGIWRPVLPELSTDRLPALARLVAAERAAGVEAAWQRRLAAMLPADVDAVTAVAARLKLANADRLRLARMATPLADPWWEAWANGAETVVDRLLLAGETGPPLPLLLAWRKPRLPATGKDLIALGVPVGREVSRRLQVFERAWVAAGMPSERASWEPLLKAAAA